MERVKRTAKRVIGLDALQKRVAVLEREVQEARAVNFRVAELCDVVSELLVPLAERDTAKVDELIEKLRQDVHTGGA